MTDYKNLFYYKFNKKVDNAIEELRHGVEYAVIFSNPDTPVTHLVFKKSQTGFVTGVEEYYETSSVVSSYINWWENHPESFPAWQIKE